MCYRFSRRASFQRATYPSSPPTFSTGSPASHHTSWLSSPLCNLHCWELWMDVLADEPQETRGIWEFVCFFPGHSGNVWDVPYLFLLFFPLLISLFLLSLWYFCPSQMNSGMDQTRISLIWPFLCCISIYWSLILMFGDALKKNQDVWRTRMSDYLGGLFSFICLLLIVMFIFFFSQERIIEAVVPQWLKRHFNILF